MSANLTLKLIEEHRIHRLLPGCPAGARLEASGVLFLDESYYIVFDNRKEVAALPRELKLPETANSLIGVETYEEGYEGITYNPNKERLYLLIESRRREEHYHAVVVEGARTEDGMKIVKERPLEFEFESGNKGFEAVAYIAHEGNDYVLALCEGNKCKGGKAGRKPGGGRIRVFKKAKKSWTPAQRKKRRIKLPASVRFKDYSAMAVRLEEGRFAILSQENSEMWVGVFDREKWKWIDEGKTYQFPRAPDGKILYGNVEGVAWISPKRLVVVSDKRKSKQDPRVEEKDQSIHIFELPN